MPLHESNWKVLGLPPYFARGLINTAWRINAVCYKQLTRPCSTPETSCPCPHLLVDYFWKDNANILGQC